MPADTCFDHSFILARMTDTATATPAITARQGSMLRGELPIFFVQGLVGTQPTHCRHGHRDLTISQIMGSFAAYSRCWSHVGSSEVAHHDGSIVTRDNSSIICCKSNTGKSTLELTRTS